MPKIDVCIVAARRPDLLAATLESLSKRMLDHFEIENVHMNLDPIFGDDDAHAACLELVRGGFRRRSSLSRKRRASAALFVGSGRPPRQISSCTSRTIGSP